MRLLSNLLEKVVKNGTLRLYDAAGRLRIFGGKLPGPVATVRIHQPGLETKLFLNPELRAGEAYMDGTLTVEEGSTIHDFILLFSVNPGFAGHFSQKILRQVWRALRRSTYLAGTNTRRVRRELGAVFGGAVGRDTVSRVWRKVKSDWDAWNARSLAEEPIVRLILDGTVVRVRLDRKAISISLLVVIGVRMDGQNVLLAIRSMGGESTEAWRTVLDDLVKRGLRRPEFLIVAGASGLDIAIAAVWGDVPVQQCTVHKHRNLLAHGPERLHDEIAADYNDMIYAATREEIAASRKAFIRKRRFKHRAVADSLEEAGDRLFTFTRLPPSQWRSARSTNAIERLHEEFKRRIKDADRASFRKNRGHAVLGAARFRSDQHAQSRWMADARHKAHRSAN
jgi:transposase-like protein